MSGTSFDGVDVALIETDGDAVVVAGPSGYRPYQDAERRLLRQALTEAAAMLRDRNDRPGSLAAAEQAVTAAHAEAVTRFLAEHALAPDSIDIVGFHGQTVLHRPERRLTVQIGDAESLARAVALPVISDFRAADVAAGGQGAPLVPVYHRALIQAQQLTGPVAVVNIGGVSNITYIDGSEHLIACDTGPGNALIDDFVHRRLGLPFDEGGRLAAQGTADAQWLAASLRLPFFSAPPPKSLDRNDFAALALGDAVSVADGAATLTAFTAAAIARIVPLLPKAPSAWIVVGGGARNPTLLDMLQDQFAPARVVTGDSLGWSSDAVEAQAFAYLAVRALRGLPLSYPTTTGVPEPMPGGVLSRP